MTSTDTRTAAIRTIGCTLNGWLFGGANALLEICTRVAAGETDPRPVANDMRDAEECDIAWEAFWSAVDGVFMMGDVEVGNSDRFEERSFPTYLYEEVLDRFGCSVDDLMAVFGTGDPQDTARAFLDAFDALRNGEC